MWERALKNADVLCIIAKSGFRRLCKVDKTRLKAGGGVFSKNKESLL